MVYRKNGQQRLGRPQQAKPKSLADRKKKKKKNCEPHSVGKSGSWAVVRVDL